MIVALTYDTATQEQAGRLGIWLARLGVYPRHTLLVFVERNVTRHIVSDLVPLFLDVIEVEYIDNIQHYPESKNLAFQNAAIYVENSYASEKLWLYLEPDAVPMRASFLDEIELAAAAGGRPFMGPMVPASAQHNTTAHMASVAVYPVKMVAAGAGDALNAHETPFPAAISAVTLRSMLPTTLIAHDWEGKGPGDCALYHPDRDGKVLENLSAPVLTAVLEGAGESTEPPTDLLEAQADSPGGQFISEATEPGPADPPNAALAQSGGVGAVSPSVDEISDLLTKQHAPWDNRLESEEAVKSLVASLKPFCSSASGTRYVRKILRAAKVTR